jgi:hypothetical protein
LKSVFHADFPENNNFRRILLANEKVNKKATLWIVAVIPSIWIGPVGIGTIGCGARTRATERMKTWSRGRVGRKRSGRRRRRIATARRRRDGIGII